MPEYTTWLCRIKIPRSGSQRTASALELTWDTMDRFPRAMLAVSPSSILTECHQSNPEQLLPDACS